MKLQAINANGKAKLAVAVPNSSEIIRYKQILNTSAMGKVKLTPKQFLEQKEDATIPTKWEDEQFYLLGYVYELMQEYADYCDGKKRPDTESNCNLADVSGMCECENPVDAGSDYPDVFHKCSKCGLSID